MIRHMYQYLKSEKLHYLAELDDEEGVIGEDFFESTEEFLEHVKENDIKYVGKIDAELMLSEMLNKELKNEIESNKELGIEPMNGRIYPPDFLKKQYKMKEIKDLTTKQLIHIADLASGGYCKSEFSSLHEEVEDLLYGKRRCLEWLQNTEGYNEEHYFKISSEFPDGWAWYHQSRYKGSNGWKTINTIAPHRIVDYLRDEGFNIENNKL